MNALRVILGSFALMALMICQSAGAAENMEVVTIPGSTDVAAKDVAPDIMLAVLAVSQTLRGDRDLSKGLGTTQRAPGAKIASHDAGPNGGDSDTTDINSRVSRSTSSSPRRALIRAVA